MLGVAGCFFLMAAGPDRLNTFDVPYDADICRYLKGTVKKRVLEQGVLLVRRLHAV